MSVGSQGHGIGAPAGNGRFLKLTLGSVGVVYGDIGTSPLYAMRESLLHIGGTPSHEEIIGVVSLLIWSLILVVTLKYVVLILRADNNGEGGALSLMALAQTALGRPSKVIVALGVVGAALFYGDAILTPAISVLSAVEGLKVTTPGLGPYVVPIAVVILVLLYAAQSFGTAGIGTLFGPIMVVWFVVLAVIGLTHIGDAPQILAALNPLHALRFLFGHGIIGFTVLGAVFLAVTGAEALYADMGHFGRGPIRSAWLVFVCPALTINYLGQGAFALAEPEAISNLFFLSAPEWARLPLVILATAATVIAGQAVITGAYSLTRQAMQLGLLPHLEVRQTSETEHGQIYLPKVTWLMLAGVLALVLMFETSSALASAYGIAVTGTMIVTSLLAVVVFAKGWGWGLPLALLVVTPFMIVDGAFLAANLLKLADGGYIPVLLGAMIFVVMWTWMRGTEIVTAKVRRDSVPLADFVASLARSASLARVPGTAVFLTSTPEIAPSALLHNLKHNRVLHDQNVVVTVVTERAPYVADADRLRFHRLTDDFSTLEIRYGFMEDPNVPRALLLAKSEGLKFDIMSTSFFLGRRSLRPLARRGMPRWQDVLFVKLMRSSHDATEYFRIPAERVVELGTQMTI